MLMLNRNCVYVTQVLCLLHRYCAYSCKDKITRDLLGPTNFIFGTEAVRTLCCHVQCCFSLPLIHLSDQGFDDQCPDPEECQFCCNLDRSSMARLLDILINSYRRKSILNIAELHLSGLWLTGSAWPSVNLFRILKTNMPCNYRLLDQVQHSVMASFISIQPLEAGLAGTRAQSCDRYASGTLHPGQVLGGSLSLLSLAFRHSHFHRQVPVGPLWLIELQIRPG